MIGFWKTYFNVEKKKLLKFFGFIFKSHWIKTAGVAFKFSHLWFSEKL